jgi:hypothetical protein
MGEIDNVHNPEYEGKAQRHQGKDASHEDAVYDELGCKFHFWVHLDEKTKNEQCRSKFPLSSGNAPPLFTSMLDYFQLGKGYMRFSVANSKG